MKCTATEKHTGIFNPGKDKIKGLVTKILNGICKYN